MSNKSLRNRQLTLIHVGRQALGMDDDSYRNMLWTLGRVRSSGDLDEAGRRKVIDHLKALGFKPKPKKHRHRNPIKGRQVKKFDPLEKIQALLVVLNAGWAYADAIAKNMHGVESVGFLTIDQSRDVIAALNVKAQKKLRTHLDGLLIGSDYTWADYYRMAAKHGYNGNKLESSVYFMGKVIEDIQGQPYGNSPVNWTKTRPRPHV